MKRHYIYRCACGADTAVNAGKLGTMVRCRGCGTDFVAGKKDVRPAGKDDIRPTRGQNVLERSWRPGEIVFEGVEIDRLIGKGGMGCVYRVIHRTWGTPLAMKAPWRHVYADAVGRANFERECQAWSDLGVHPHVIGCYFVRRFDEIPLVFSEYAPRGSLHDWIRSRRIYQGGPTRALARILDIAIQFAWGLHYAHEQGLVHQDVKPGNVLLARGRQVKIADFGLARALPRQERGRGTSRKRPTVTGYGMTQAYASPEQSAGEQLDRRTDIWSWGVSVLEMFSGEATWVSGTVAPQLLEETFSGRAGGPGAGRPGMPAGIAEILRRCFQREAGARPGTMLDVANGFRECYQEATGTFYPRPLPSFSRDQGGTIDTATRNNQAMSALELGDVKKAETLLKEAELTSRAFESIEPNPVLQDVVYNRCLLQIRTNPVFDARAVPQLIPDKPDPHKHRYYSSALLLEAGEPARALEQIDSSLTSTNPYLARVLNVRGICLLLLGETKPARLCFAQAHRQAPEAGEYLRNVAVADFYDGRSGRAAQAFCRYAHNRRLSNDDTVRYAALLSASGLGRDAARWLDTGLGGGSCSADSLLTGAELLAGYTAFVPKIHRVDGPSHSASSLIQQAADREPQNLRAHYDAATKNSGRAPRPISRIRKRRRLPPGDDEPADRVAQFALGGLARFGASRQGIASRASSSPRWRYMFVSAVPAVAVAFAASPRVFGPDMFGPALGEVPAQLAGLISAFVWAAVLVAVIRPSVVSRLGRFALRDCLGLPLVFFVPTAAHILYLTNLGLLAERSALWRQGGVFGLAGALLALAVVGRDSIYGMFLTRSRAFGAWSPPSPAGVGQRATGDTAVRRRLSTFAEGVFPSIDANADGAIPRLRRGLGARLAVAAGNLREAMRNVVEDARAGCGTWQLLLVPQFVVLAVLDSRWVFKSPVENPAAYLALMIASNACILLYAALAARTFLVLNFGVWLLTAAGVFRWASDAAPGLAYPALAAAAAAFCLLNWLAIQRCPSFAERWDSLRHPRYDARSMVDPLNIRGSAATWQVVRADSGPAADGPAMAGVLRGERAGD